MDLYFPSVDGDLGMAFVPVIVSLSGCVFSF